MIEILLEIENEGGLLLQDGIVVRTTRELEHMQGWSRNHIDLHCKENHWKINTLRMFKQGDLFEEKRV